MLAHGASSDILEVSYRLDRFSTESGDEDSGPRPTFSTLRSESESKYLSLCERRS